MWRPIIITCILLLNEVPKSPFFCIQGFKKKKKQPLFTFKNVVFMLNSELQMMQSAGIQNLTRFSNELIWHSGKALFV